MVAILLPIRDVVGWNLGHKVVYPKRFFFFFAVLPQIFREHRGANSSAHQRPLLQPSLLTFIVHRTFRRLATYRATTY